uniref:WGS project CAEQ00000000 data, annotated contig 1326 n=1 Tax=Trypanosoma congolense (strain IL3000) TaxID=1068625 RepID=F9W5H6_TRYCI|nr:unnamed protein product [Trypanosoma congolense IL3000]
MKVVVWGSKRELSFSRSFCRTLGYSGFFLLEACCVSVGCMWPKVFAPLLAFRHAPANKFPQLKLRLRQERSLTHKREISIPLSSFDPKSIDFAHREIPQGSVVEIRDADHHRLLALGFYEPSLLRVDVFHFSPKVVTDLPVISEEFFLDRMKGAWERRQRVFRHSENGSTNAYRIVNGYADGIPSLYVDLFSSGFARVVATSTGAERIVPAVCELLRQRGVEEVLLDTPFLKGCEKVTFITPTITLPQLYVESGASNLWLPRDVHPGTSTNRWLLNTAHRRSRLLLRELCHGKRVLCVNDRSGAAALQAAMVAKQVLVSETDGPLLDRVRENLVSNHGMAIFSTCETTNAGVDHVNPRRHDVVYLEHRSDDLSTQQQWGSMLRTLLRRGICGNGSVLIAAQEVATLGIHDYAIPQSKNVGCSVPANREDIVNTFSGVAGEHGLSLRLLRFFGPSIDHPIMSYMDPACFSYVFLLQTK